ncbi:MAG: aminotransferase class I/II-fold pyridoxal phosphate-dependent enzyme [Candidatus Micrarchaeia archaeon]
MSATKTTYKYRIKPYKNATFLSKLSAYASSPIREDDEVAWKLIENGKKVIKLNTGDPAKYFKTPERVINAYIEALRKNYTYYSNSQGILELREAIAKRHKKMYGLDIGPEKILITQGISEGLQFLNTATIDKGDKSILIKPYYPSYLPYLLVTGGRPIFGEAKWEKGWEIDLESLEKSVKREKRKKLKYMLITTPNNPACYVISRKKLREIVDFANEYDIFLVSDEIYDELVFKGNFTSLSQVADGLPYMILNGMSKNFVGTGLRIGYMLIPNDDNKSSRLLSKMIELAQMRLSPNTPAQLAYAVGLQDLEAHRKEVEKLRKEIKERTYFATKEVNESKYMHALLPGGAFYVFPKIELNKLRFKDDKTFVQNLLFEKYVQVTRGSGFGMPGYIRIVTLPPKGVLKDAIDKIDSFCKIHSR